jgi:DNA transposition AAA+ family ATPase
MDEQALTRDLKRFFEESDLSIPKIASKMGAFSAILSMWIAGTTKPSRTELLAIKCFLERRDGGFPGRSGRTLPKPEKSVMRYVF